MRRKAYEITAQVGNLISNEVGSLIPLVSGDLGWPRAELASLYRVMLVEPLFPPAIQFTSRVSGVGLRVLGFLGSGFRV